MGTSELRRSTVSWTIIRASGLRKVTKLISLNCYAEVSVDDRPIGQTEPVKGNQPQWNAEFELDISDNSIVKIKIFHRSLIPPDIFRGEALIPGSVVFSTASENVERMYDLVKPGSNDVSGRGCVVVSYQHRSPPLGANPSVPKTASDGGSLSSAVTSGPIDSLQEGLVSTEIEKARVSVTKMSSQGAIPETGEIITTVTNTAASDNVTTVLGYLNKLVSLGDVLSEVHPYAKTAWDVLTVAHKIFSLQEERDTHIRQLWSTAADMLSLLKDAQPLIDPQRDKKDTLIPIVSEMMTQIHSCALFLQEYGEKGVLGRTVRDTFNSTSDDKLEHFIHSFKDLKERFAARTVLKTWQGVLRVQDGLHQLSSIHETNKESEDLECLLGERLKDVTWDLGNVCLPNTRQAVLDHIEHWIDDPDGGSLYWLNGVAGAGKSTIANTVANIFRQRGRLAGSFRFSRDASHRNVADYLCGNLAYQLAHFDGRFKRGVLSAIKDGGRSVHIVPIHNQLKRFIVDVLKAVEINEPIIFVIDALDEIESEAGRRKLLRAIAAESRNMPNFAKLLITSRNERDIRNILNTHCISSSIDEAEGITADIRTYVDFRIKHIREANERPHKYPDWPGLDYRDALARRAAGLFIWIEVACNYIDGGDPDVRLHDVVSGECSEGPQVVLDALYLSILRNAGVKSEDVKYVMGSILVLKMPLTREGLDMFLGLGQHTIRNPISLPDGSQVRLVSTDVTIASLGSMLQCGSGDHRNDRIRILHPSLFDFFTTPGRCNDARFAIDIQDQNRILTICCLDAMELLERDICKINNPTKMNSEVHDLDDRLQKYVPEHVRYACQFWTQHLTDVPRDVQVYDRAKNFLFGHLLHWLEVMSLLRFVDAVIPSLTRIRNWFWDPSKSKHDTVNTLLDDAIRFVQQFDVPLRASAAHIYVSGLAFTPATTTLSKIFADQVDSIPKVISGLHPLWPACLAVFQVDTEGLHGLKNTISISPDGSRFLFSRDGRVIQVLDSATGTAVCQPLVGHTGRIFSTAFSPDGSWIITHCWDDHCEDDATIRVWNARTGDSCGRFFCSTFRAAAHCHEMGPVLL